MTEDQFWRIAITVVVVGLFVHFRPVLEKITLEQMAAKLGRCCGKALRLLRRQ